MVTGLQVITKGDGVDFLLAIKAVLEPRLLLHLTNDNNIQISKAKYKT